MCLLCGLPGNVSPWLCLRRALNFSGWSKEDKLGSGSDQSGLLEQRCWERRGGRCLSYNFTSWSHSDCDAGSGPSQASLLLVALSLSFSLFFPLSCSCALLGSIELWTQFGFSAAKKWTPGNRDTDKSIQQHPALCHPPSSWIVTSVLLPVSHLGPPLCGLWPPSPHQGPQNQGARTPLWCLSSYTLALYPCIPNGLSSSAGTTDPLLPTAALMVPATESKDQPLK